MHPVLRCGHMRPFTLAQGLCSLFKYGIHPLWKMLYIKKSAPVSSAAFHSSSSVAPGRAYLLGHVGKGLIEGCVVLGKQRRVLKNSKNNDAAILLHPSAKG